MIFIIEKIIQSIENVQKVNNKLLQTKEKIEKENLEKYFYEFEKARMDMYEDVRKENLWYKFMEEETIKSISNNYTAHLEDNVLKIYIPEYDDTKIWDADNRNVKPIQDGLVHGKIIKDDNIYCASYMVQGYYSDTPHIKVFVAPADEITKIINRFIR